MRSNEKNHCSKIVSIPREESLLQIASGIYYQNAILQNLSEQDICFDSKDFIDQERNAVDLYDQRDSKGQMSFISFKEGFPKRLFTGGKERLKSAASKVFSEFGCAACAKQ